MSVRIFLNLAQYSSQVESVNFLTDVDTLMTPADMITFAGTKGVAHVPGTSADADPRFTGMIECLHYEHQLGQAVANFPTAGIAVHNTFYLQKFVDRSSAALANYCHYSLPLLYAIIYVVNDVNPRVNLFQYLLTGVNVARVRHSDAHAADTTFVPATTPPAQITINADGLPRESFHLAYRGIVWIAYDSSGIAHTASADRLWGPNTPGSNNAGA